MNTIGAPVSNKRQFSRIEFEAETHLIRGGQRLKARLVDISLKGALIAFDKPMPFRHMERCALTVQLSGSTVELHFEAEVVHIDMERIGVRFVSLDLESFTHLRGILEANTGDPDLIDREIITFATR